MIKRRKLMGIIASVVLAGLGTALLVTYVRSAAHRARQGDKTASVLVATDTIPKGTKAEELTNRVRPELVPTKVMATGAVATLAPLAGQVTSVELLAGEQLVQGRFTTAAAAAAVGVPPGSLQVTVAMDALRAIGGQVRSGDSVAVLASFDDPESTRLMLQKVPVTDVRTELGAPVTTKASGQAPTGRLFVTLALDAPSVERVVFAAEHGRLWLSWEPKDANEGGTKMQSRIGVNL